MKINIIGSTGSIGTQTLEVVRNLPDIEVNALAGGHNLALLEQQVREFHPQFVSVWEEEDARRLQSNLSDLSVEVGYGMEGLIEAACRKPASMVVTAVVGMLGLRPTIRAIENGLDIALANKETLVCAGHIIMPLARKNNISILPVDSEHSAIFQSLQGNEKNPIHKILLTASGGPFRGKKREDLAKIKPEDALKHPNWTMGRKITIDSATLVNKGLEVMEAKWLFDVELEQIEVVVHPESVIHSMVEYEDGAVMAQLGTPDMKIPIQYALTYPRRVYLPGKRLDLFSLGKLTFEAPDEDTFVGLHLAKKALDLGGNMPTIFNAANECAVSLFLDGRISFLEIAESIGQAMEEVRFRAEANLEDILDTEREVKEWMTSYLSRRG